MNYQLMGYVPAVIPILVGVVLPATAFQFAQRGQNYVAGQDDDTDEMVLRVESALPMVTALNSPGFLGLGGFLLACRRRFDTRMLWLVSMIGTAIMAAIVLSSHMGMYDLLYIRGRMHSTSGIGFMFTSFACGAVAVIAAAGGWLVQKRLVRNTEGAERNLS